MKSIGLFFGTDGGDTENIANALKDALGDVTLFNVSSASKDDIAKFDNLIFASPTYGEGDLQGDWEDFLANIEPSDVTGKTIAFVGLGDQDGYGETFCEGISHVYNKLAASAKVIGQTSTDGYNFESSKSVVGGKFIGLMIDEANQDDKTAERISQWVAAVKSQFA